MAIYNSGLGASFGVGVESTAAMGTFVTPTGWYEIIDESMVMVPKYLDSQSLKPGQAYQRGVRTNISNYDVNGDLTLECIDKGTVSTGSSYGMAFWWKYCLGAAWTTGVTATGSTGAYRHVLTPGSKDLMSLSFQCGRPSTTSTAAQRFDYAGCKISKWDFSCSDGAIAQLKMTLDGISESTTGAAITQPVYAPATGQPMPFSFADADVFRIGTGATTTSGTTGQTTISGTADVTTVVKGITLSGETPMASSRYGLGSSGYKKNQIQNGIPMITGTLDAEFTNKTEFYDLFTSNSSRSLQIDFSHLNQGVAADGSTGTSASGGTGTNAYRMSFILPMVKFKTAQVSLNGPDILTQKISFQAYDDGANPPIQVLLVTSDQGL